MNGSNGRVIDNEPPQGRFCQSRILKHRHLVKFELSTVLFSRFLLKLLQKSKARAKYRKRPGKPSVQVMGWMMK